MSFAILDNLHAYAVELDELQAECRAKHDCESPAVAVSQRHLKACIANTENLLGAVDEAVTALGSTHPELSRQLACCLVIAKSEVPA